MNIPNSQRALPFLVPGTPVLVREDGSYLYTLPSVADDIAMGVTGN